MKIEHLPIHLQSSKRGKKNINLNQLLKDLHHINKSLIRPVKKITLIKQKVKLILNLKLINKKYKNIKNLKKEIYL